MAAFAANFFITSMKHKNIRPFYSQQAEIAVRTAIRELNNLPNVVKKQEKLKFLVRFKGKEFVEFISKYPEHLKDHDTLKTYFDSLHENSSKSDISI